LKWKVGWSGHTGTRNFFAVAGSGQASRPRPPTPIDLLNRLGTYLDDYIQSLSLLVAEEQYEQQLVII
jgi:hypothetical protein